MLSYIELAQLYKKMAPRSVAWKSNPNILIQYLIFTIYQFFAFLLLIIIIIIIFYYTTRNHKECGWGVWRVEPDAKPCNEDKARVVHGSDEPAGRVRIAAIFCGSGQDCQAMSLLYGMHVVIILSG